MPRADSKIILVWGPENTGGDNGIEKGEGGEGISVAKGSRTAIPRARQTGLTSVPALASQAYTLPWGEGYPGLQSSQQ